MFQIFASFLEPIPLCAARVDALRSHGHMEAALRLAVSVVRTMKQQQIVAQRKWHESQQSLNASSSSGVAGSSGAGSSSSSSSTTMKNRPCTSRCMGQCIAAPCPTTTSINAPANTDCWVGHPLDPIGCLFDTLCDASIVPEDERAHPFVPSYFGDYFNFYL